MPQKKKKIKVKNISSFTSENPNPVIRMSDRGKIIYANLPGKLLWAKLKKVSNRGEFSFFLKLIKEAFTQKKTKKIEIDVGRDTFFFFIVPVTGKRYVNLYASNISERAKSVRNLRQEREVALKVADESTGRLIEAQKELKKAKRLADIGTLAATVAHELRNPLGVIQTAVFNIKRKRSNTGIDKHISNIEKKNLESSQIINNLLTYSQIKPPAKERCSIFDILEETIDTSKKRFYNQNVIMRRELEPVKEADIEADTFQIKEVLANVLNNAFQAVKGKKGVITIKGSLNGKGSVVIECIDNGTGIDKNDLDRVFEPFYTKKSKGTGLGLSISAEIVHLHDGEIDIRSRKGKGTSVSISLPVKRS